MNDGIKIASLSHISRSGLKANFLYCFNYNLEGDLCNKCADQETCEIERIKLAQIAKSIKQKASQENHTSLKKLERIINNDRF